MNDQVEITSARLNKNAPSGKAGLFRIGNESFWIPWSVIDPGSKCLSPGQSGVMYLEKWFAEKENIPFDSEV